MIFTIEHKQMSSLNLIILHQEH